MRFRLPIIYVFRFKSDNAKSSGDSGTTVLAESKFIVPSPTHVGYRFIDDVRRNTERI